MMPTKHRQIPSLPERPRIRAVAGHITRSYTAGRQHFSRSVQGEIINVTIHSEDLIPTNISIRLMATRHANGNSNNLQAAFVRIDDRTLTCHFTPDVPGLYSYRAEYSPDNGFTWIQDTVPDAWVLVDPKQADGVRLYTMIPAISGTIEDWTEDLNRIAGMGFSAIHLLPVTTQDTSESPYSASDLFSIDPAYVTSEEGADGLAQLEEYIDAAKTVGIRLCFDLVLNHVGVNSRMARHAPDWIVPDPNKPDGLMRARYWCGDQWLSWDDLVLVNYEHPSETIRAEIWAYMTA
jgi:glycosidase